MISKNTSKKAKTKDVINNHMNWFGASSSPFMEVHSKQMESIKDMYLKVTNSHFIELQKAFNVNLSNMSMKMIDLMQKNMEGFIMASETSINKIMESSIQAPEAYRFSEDIFHAMNNNFNKQLDTIKSFNNNYYDTILKQFNTTPFSLEQESENSKKEFEANFNLSKESMHEIVNSYAKLKAPTVKANKKLLFDLNRNMNTMAENNFKLWSDLLSKYDTEKARTDRSEFSKFSNRTGNGKAKAPATEEK